MKRQTLHKIAEELRTEIVYEKFGYWDQVAHINGTALAFYVHGVDTNTTCVCTNPELFPRFCTKNYIKSAIEDEADCLGYYKSYAYTQKPFAEKQWFQYNEE